VEPLLGTIRDYAWGSRSVLARMQGRPEPTDGPEAELWLGAHPGAPATVVRDDADVGLDALIARAPADWLGAAAAERFGPRLPYLLKVLAAESPLSLQAHPDADRAAERFAAGDPNYVDPHHKPELLVAVTRFEALCGFRDPERSADVLAALGEPALDPVVDHLRRGPEGLREAVHLLLTGLDDPAGAVERAVRAPVPPRFADDLTLLARLAVGHPADPGVLVALLLNQVTLAPGEAVWMPAGNLHAYLLGAGVEIMAASDNVLRGGLTAKRVDAGELLRVLRFEVLAEPVVKPVPVTPGVVTWPVPVDDFALHRVTLGDETDRVRLAPPGPRVVLCTAGAVSCADAAGEVALTPGRAAVGPATGADLAITGSGEAFVASLGG
jgi:mannose-6-phosphate isomerase